MFRPSRSTLLRTLPYLALLAVTQGCLHYFMPGSFSVLDLAGPEMYVPRPPRPGKIQVEVACPTRAYEYETIELTVAVKGFGNDSPPSHFIVETSDEIEIEGTKERPVKFSENWFLVPKEQGEYVIVVRGNGLAKGFERDVPLTVFKIYGISRRWFVILLWTGSVAGLIGTIRGLLTPKKTTSVT